MRAMCGWPVRAQMCRASGCSVYTTRRLSGSLSPGHPKLVLTLRKMFHEWSDVKNARNSNFLSSNCCVPNLWTMTMATKATGFPALLINLQLVQRSTAKSSSSIPSNACSFLCLTCWLRGTILYSCWVLAMSSSCSKVGSLILRLLSTILIQF